MAMTYPGCKEGRNGMMGTYPCEAGPGIPMPRWCQKQQLPMAESRPSKEECSGQLKESIMELLNFYLEPQKREKPAASSMKVQSMPSLPSMPWPPEISRDASMTAMRSRPRPPVRSLDCLPHMAVSSLDSLPELYESKWMSSPQRFGSMDSLPYMAVSTMDSLPTQQFRSMDSLPNMAVSTMDSLPEVDENFMEQQGCITSFGPPGLLQPQQISTKMEQISSKMEHEDASTRCSRSVSPDSQDSLVDRVNDNLDLHKLVKPLSLGLQVTPGCFSPQNLEQQNVQGVSALQHARNVAAAGGGLCGYATVMVQQIPFEYTQSKLMCEINNNGFEGTYDFFFVPVNAKSHGNRGFGFINFLNGTLAERFYRTYQGQKFKLYKSSTVISVTPAEAQGFEESAACFFASWHMRKRKRHSEPVFLRPVPASVKEAGLDRARTRTSNAY